MGSSDSSATRLHAGANSAPKLTLPSDSRFGPYHILAPLGAGGMGEVYRARDSRLGREVALKVLPAEVAGNDDRRRRFELEARSASSLNHPSIVTVHELGQVDSTFYIAMELVEGDTLRALMESGLLPLRRVIHIAAQVAEGLAKAHEAGIVHRDLKPENVMISRDGFAKILDFGLAKLAPDAATAVAQQLTAAGVTTPGTILGTVAYMSPEQASGRAVDFRSDQFSFAVMLYEAITGQPAFQRASQVETLTAILRDQPTPIGRLNLQAPAPLCWLVDRCLSKSPEERYASTRDLARDLATIRDTFLQTSAKPAEGRASTLPVPRTTFVGREREVEAVQALLARPDVRLVTLTGPGGIGKTRLALHVADALAAGFPGGVFFVPLGTVSDPALPAALILEALGVRITGGQPALHRLKEFLLEAQEPLLLVLDNFEHLLPAAAMISELLAAGNHLKVLATSRAPLHVYGEHEFPVPTLAAPAAGARLSELRRSPAVELFVQRAAAVKPGFELTEDNAAAVAKVCARLDGLPLAIELAAARVKLLSPSAIESRLQSRLQLLTGGARDLPQRQQTLRGTIDWSYDLLNAEEQKLFRRLAVFCGGCTLEAVEAVCNTDGKLGLDVLDGMASVVDKSLVQQHDSADGEVRFSMLETIREYGALRLAESGEEKATRRAHAAYFLVLAEEGATAGTDEERTRWLDRLELDHDNLRAAMDWLIETGNADWAQRLGAALFQFWETREHLSEGRARLRAVLQLPGAAARTKERARVLFASGVLSAGQGEYPPAIAQLEESLQISRENHDQWGVAVAVNALAVLIRDRGDFAKARALFEEGLALWRQLGDRVAVARSLSNLANVVRAQRDFALARSLYEECLGIFREIGDQSGMAWSLNSQGDTARDQGDERAARSLYEQGLAIFRALGDRWGIAGSLADLGNLAREHGDYATAHQYHAESLKVFEQLGHKRGIARLLECFACSAAAQCRPERSLRLAGAAAALRHGLGAPLTPADQHSLEKKIEPARQALGQGPGTAAWLEGWELPLDQAIAAALAPEPPKD
jgi:predicted ATPase